MTCLDMTALIVLVVVATAGRNISRDLGETDMLVMSSMASALFMGLRLFNVSTESEVTQ